MSRMTFAYGNTPIHLLFLFRILEKNMISFLSREVTIRAMYSGFDEMCRDIFPHTAHATWAGINGFVCDFTVSHLAIIQAKN